MRIISGAILNKISHKQSQLLLDIVLQHSITPDHVISKSPDSVAMFADDTKLFSAIKCQSDTVLLQNDLRCLEHWSSISGLTFNESKCKQQRITRKITPITSTYMLNDQQLDTTDTERDLGLCVSSNLTWQTQVRQQVSKASRLLGYIRRNTMFVTDITPRRTPYLALVRSHFGYGSQIWAPQSIDLINMLERTQRRATKYILNLPFSTDMNYRTRLHSLHLLPVSYWHEYLDLTSGGNSVSEVGGQSFTNFRQHYIALLALRLHIALRKPL